MVVCRECGYQELPGALFCGQCGASLLELGGEMAVLETPIDPEPPPLLGQIVGQAEQFKEVIFMIPLSGRMLRFQLDQGDIRVGRGSPDSPPPEFDTTIENGAEYGVSRNHAVIRVSDHGVVIIDLDSTNGTMLNRYRLPPELPYPLRSGDEVTFGSLLIHVFLK